MPFVKRDAVQNLQMTRSWNGPIDFRRQACYWLCGEVQGMISWNCGMGNDFSVILLL